MLQAQAPQKPFTLDVTVLEIFKVLPLPEHLWAHIQSDLADLTVQQ